MAGKELTAALFLKRRRKINGDETMRKILNKKINNKAALALIALQVIVAVMSFFEFLGDSKEE